MTIRAVIFDGSGTLLNDLYAVWKASAEAFTAVGFDNFVTLENFKEKITLPIPEFHAANGIPPDLSLEIDRKFRESYPKYDSYVAIFPEVREVLQELKEKKTVLGVVSNIPSMFLSEHLKHFDIYSYFDVITGQEDCDEQKPSPKPIVCTVEKLGIKPREAMYVGDMEEDIIAGKGANLVTTAIVRDESYHPRWRLERQNPDFIISNLRELSALL